MRSVASKARANVGNGCGECSYALAEYFRCSCTMLAKLFKYGFFLLLSRVLPRPFPCAPSLAGLWCQNSFFYCCCCTCNRIVALWHANKYIMLVSVWSPSFPSSSSDGIECRWFNIAESYIEPGKNGDFSFSKRQCEYAKRVSSAFFSYLALCLIFLQVNCVCTPMPSEAHGILYVPKERAAVEHIKSQDEKNNQSSKEAGQSSSYTRAQ